MWSCRCPRADARWSWPNCERTDSERVRLSRAALVFASLLALAAVACRLSRTPASVPQVIVLGIDGMDPNFVERHWDTLPNLARLRQQGSFSRLGTTMPPQSPVAWSTFITGLEPDQHRIFDFVHRDPATLEPFSSMGRTEEPRFTLPLGPYILPLSGSRLVSFRHGTAFWQTLAARGIPVTVVRMPTNRSEERRVGKECRSRWSPYQSKRERV